VKEPIDGLYDIAAEIAERHAAAVFEGFHQ
jgi:hypothetical protein